MTQIMRRLYRRYQGATVHAVVSDTIVWLPVADGIPSEISTVTTACGKVLPYKRNSELWRSTRIPRSHACGDGCFTPGPAQMIASL